MTILKWRVVHLVGQAKIYLFFFTLMEKIFFMAFYFARLEVTVLLGLPTQEGGNEGSTVGI